MRAQRKAAQPSGIKTFGSTFKNPDDPRAEGRSAGVLLEEAGCRGLAVGGARFSLKHANFVENTGEATTADVIALMAEGRRRVRERFGVELEPEVQFLGEVDASALLRTEGAPPAAAAPARLRRRACGPTSPRCVAAWRCCSAPSTCSGSATPVVRGGARVGDRPARRRAATARRARREAARP